MVVANDTVSVKVIKSYFKKVNQYSHCVYYDGIMGTAPDFSKPIFLTDEVYNDRLSGGLDSSFLRQYQLSGRELQHAVHAPLPRPVKCLGKKGSTKPFCGSAWCPRTAGAHVHHEPGSELAPLIHPANYN